MFDLGNVLVHFDHRQFLKRLHSFMESSATGGGRSGVWQAVAAYERGEVTTEHFLDLVRKHAGIPAAVEDDTLRDAWCDIFWPNTPMLDLVRLLSADVRIGLISNTNELHVAYIRRRWPEVFEHVAAPVFSFETGCSKPDPSLFHVALERAGARPDGALYFDDVRSHVDAATKLGVHAYQYVSCRSVLDALSWHGFTPSCT